MFMTAADNPATSASSPIKYVREMEPKSYHPGDTDGSMSPSQLFTSGISMGDFPAPQEVTRWQEDGEKKAGASSTELPLVRTLPLASVSPTSVMARTVLPQLDVNATRILRAHFVESILDDLVQIQRHCGSTGATVYADSLLHNMRTMADLSPRDPFLDIVMALHDAMAFENTWAECTPTQYEGAHHLLKRLVNDKNTTEEKIEKGIIELEELGFDTTPFTVDNGSLELED